MTSVHKAEDLLGLHDAPFVGASYRVLLGRDADAEGMQFFRRRLLLGASREQIIWELCQSPEAQRFGSKLQGLQSLLEEHERSLQAAGDDRLQPGRKQQHQFDRIENLVGTLAVTIDQLSRQLAQCMTRVDELGDELKQFRDNRWTDQPPSHTAPPLPVTVPGAPDPEPLNEYGRALQARLRSIGDGSQRRGT